MQPDKLFELILAACSGTETVAWRTTAALAPVAGPGAPVTPPTYAEGSPIHARVGPDREQTSAVLLDSIPSQANRAEAALAEARRRGKVDLPILELTVGSGPGQRVVTSFDANHRCADAVWRDALLDGQPFYASPEGRAIRLAHALDATGLWRYYPTALLYGWFFSRTNDAKLAGITDRRLGAAITATSAPRLVAKGPRAWRSEIVGLGVVPAVRTESRLDPLGIGKVQIYATRAGGWTADPKLAMQDQDKSGDLKPVPFVSKKGKGDASAIGHSNVPPSVKPGGVTVERIEGRGVLSLPVLRRLRFPLKLDRPSDPTVDAAAQALLVLLALLADELARKDLALRSGCELVVVERRSEWVRADGSTEPAAMDEAALLEAFQHAVQHARDVGLPWTPDVVRLSASPSLEGLVAVSDTEAVSDPDATAG